MIVKYKRRCYFVIICLLCIIISACTKVTDGSTIIKSQNISSDSIPHNTLSIEEKNNNLLGYWLWSEVAFRDIDRVTMNSRINNGRDEDCIGTISECADYYFKRNNEIYDDVRYVFQEVNLYDILRETNVSRTDLQNFISKYSLETEDIVKVLIKKEDVIVEHFYEIDTDHLLVCIGGTYIWTVRIDPTKLNQEDIPLPPMYPDPTILYGIWEITEFIDIHNDSNNGDSPNYLGQTLEYQKDFCILENKVFEKPVYSYDAFVPAQDIVKNFELWTDTQFNELLIENSIEQIENYLVQGIILEKNSGDEVLGEFLYIIDENHILIHYNGILYLAVKVYKVQVVSNYHIA